MRSPTCRFVRPNGALPFYGCVAFAILIVFCEKRADEVAMRAASEASEGAAKADSVCTGVGTAKRSHSHTPTNQDMHDKQSHEHTITNKHKQTQRRSTHPNT